MEIPEQVILNSMTAPDGTLAFFGPGEKTVMTLTGWRKQFGNQQGFVFGTAFVQIGERLGETENWQY